MTPAAQSPQAPALPQQAQALLEQMHGIVTPTAVTWWPPAIGWWVLTAVLLAAVLAVVLILRQRRARAAYRKIALDLLEDLLRCGDAELPAEANRLLKRVALTAFPADRLTINQAFGDAWANWLNERCRQPVFSDAAAAAIARGGYQPDVSCPRDELLASVRRWILDHKITATPAASRSSASV